MKKIISLVIPLITISLLTSCGGSKSQEQIEHFVTFESYGGDHIPTQRVKDGDTATPPEDPKRGNDEFLGWFIDFDQPKYDFTKEVTYDITLYAKWEENPDPLVTHHFKFTGNQCSINGTNFEIDLPSGTQTQFQIDPDAGCKIPTFDEDHFEIESGEDCVDYDDSKGLIKINNMTEDVTIWAKSEPVKYLTVTLNAGEGAYASGSKYKIDVKEGDNLSKNIRLVASPYLSEKTFMYYTYSDGTAIDYDDAVTSNVELVAHYFDADNTPYDDLWNISWDQIKAVAVTNENPRFCFKIGATKTVKVNNLDHKVRIIGFNQDKDPNGNSLGITFEFENLITGADGIEVFIDWSKGTDSKNYDYRESTLNNTLNETKDDDSVINMLPDDLKKVIEPVDKKVGVSTDEGSTYIATSFNGKKYPYPRLFPLAYYEMHNPDDESVTPNETNGIYEYYEGHGEDGDNEYRVKKRAGAGEYDNFDYWLRSPNTELDQIAWYLSDGHFFKDFHYIYSHLAVAPAFCV